MSSPIVSCERLEALVGGLDENLRLVAGTPQHPLDAQHFVADGVTVTQRRQHLMNGGPRHRVLRAVEPRRRG